ncbi:MAG: LytR/AlgR family response regulator transcription factor, partial [Kordiimonas sp.]
VSLVLGASHANVVNNAMGIEESFLGTFYYMVPIVLGTYVVFLAVSLLYVRRLPDVRDEQKRDEPTLVVNKGRTIVWLKESQVDWMQAARNYVEVHADGQTYILRNTLSKMEETLESKSFVRIHRSYLVNRDSIDGVNKNRDGSALVLMKDGSELPCGRAHREALAPVLSTAS